MRIAIFTHVIHREHNGRYLAYSPYVREMNIWLKNVEEVEIVAPGRFSIASGTGSENTTMGLPYLHSNLTFTKIPSFALLDFTSSLKAVFKIPITIFKIIGAMKHADHLHLRCPGNIGLLGCICQIFFPYKQKTAKYAGNWDPNAKQPWTYKLQRWILSKTFLTRNMTVLVYGVWPDQSKNILPFFTASFSESEKELINKIFTIPYKFLFVGNLVSGKQPAVAIEIVGNLVAKNIPAELHIYGDGELMKELRDHAENKDYIHLHRNQSLEVLKQAYKGAHFIILASKSEGWPKAVAEGMFFGCLPIATAVSCVPWMLAAPSAPEGEAPKVMVTERGILMPDLTKQKEVILDRGQRKTSPVVRAGRTEKKLTLVNETVERITELIQDPEEMRSMSLAAQEWSQQYTLERFEEAIKEVLALQPSKEE